MIDPGNVLTFTLTGRNVLRMTTIQIGSKVSAVTTTPAQQQVVIEVSGIDHETESGWFVYGYRTGRSARRRSTMYPQRYFVAKLA